MKPALPPWLRSLMPARASVSHGERVRSAIGALLGILVTGLVSAQLAPSPSVALWSLSAKPTTASDEAPLADLVRLMCDVGFHHLPAVDAPGCGRVAG